MLISMPHGTSTIFGVFQAILALLANWATSALPLKLSSDENFASEFFGRQRPQRFVRCKINLGGNTSNRSRIKGFALPFRDRNAGPAAVANRKYRIKNL
jgi:hypothetical protein